MTEGQGAGSGGSGWLTGCAIAAGVGAVLLLIVVGLGVTGAMFFVGTARNQPAQTWPPPAPYATAEDALVSEWEEGAEADPAEGDENLGPFLYRVVVKLSGVGPKGVKYVILDEGEEIEECEGDAELVAALQEMAAGEDDDPDDDAKLVVDLDVATAAPIRQEHVDAAVKACWSAGAAVMPPPDLSKDRPAAPAATPKPAPVPARPGPPATEEKEAIP